MNRLLVSACQPTRAFNYMIQRAYYERDIRGFLRESQTQVLGELANMNQFELEVSQRNSWLEEIAGLQIQLREFSIGHIFFEFSIPRMGKRVDVLLVIGGVIFVVEYKIGSYSHERYEIEQAIDYAVDLKNFHEGSHDKYIVPILISTKATKQPNTIAWHEDRVLRPLLSSGDDLGEIIRLALAAIGSQNALDALTWANSGYRPTPTIVEAAQALYGKHSVEEISRSDAGATNLTRTSECIFEIIDFSKTHLRKSICFVTGVPGAGKTLAGLNISTKRSKPDEEEFAVFLSGNGPLVTVLREALARDEVSKSSKPLSKKTSAARVSAFIQNIHHFRDELLKTQAPPVEHVVVFDEAQRAWNREAAQKFMVQKRGASEFNMSEPEFLISAMNRRDDWCTVICLIGGGQEINTGEGGLTEWFDALQNHFQGWDVYCSSQISDKEYSWERIPLNQRKGINFLYKDALHLSVSIRSFRAEKLSSLIGAIIDGDLHGAISLYNLVRNDYPIVITRDIAGARAWLRTKSRGSERFGLVASSGAIRLKPEGVNVKSDINPVAWFLNDSYDIRSSFYLEDVATEFDIQGLELDWTCVCWDADFRRRANEWHFHSFRGTSWQNVNDQTRRIYLANAYRVLLTRARQGMAIFIPKGDSNDHTRLPSFYQETFEFLTSCGIPAI